MAGIDDRIAFEFNPSVLNETSFSYNDFYFIIFRLQNRVLKRTNWGHLMISRIDSTVKRGKNLIKAEY